MAEDGEVQGDVQDQVEDDEEFERVCVVAAEVIDDDALGGIAEHEVSHQTHQQTHAHSHDHSGVAHTHPGAAASDLGVHEIVCMECTGRA